MAFTITGRITDLDLDVPTHVGLVVTAFEPVEVDEGQVRLINATGKVTPTGEVVKATAPGEPDQPWVIAAPEGTRLRLGTTSFVGYFPTKEFTAPADGAVLDIADLITLTTTRPASTPMGRYVRGASAYEVAVAEGYPGTEEEWLAELEGPPGPPGPSAYEVAVESGFTGTEEEWLASLIGSPEAIEVALDVHRNEAEPHAAYDRDLLNLTVIFDNVLA